MDIIDKSGLDSWSDLLPEFNESGFMKESWYIWLVVVDPVPELEAEDEGLKKGDEDGDKAPFFGSKVPNLRPFSVRNLGGPPAGGLTSSRSFWLFLAFISSAASALDMFSCFFHLVRRFWNQIFTWKVNNLINKRHGSWWSNSETRFKHKSHSSKYICKLRKCALIQAYLLSMVL